MCVCAMHYGYKVKLAPLLSQTLDTRRPRRVHRYDEGKLIRN